MIALRALATVAVIFLLLVLAALLAFVMQAEDTTHDRTGDWANYYKDVVSAYFKIRIPRR